MNSGCRLRNEEDARAWERDDPLPQREEELCGHQSVTRIVLEQWLPGDTSQNSLPHAEKLQQIIREKIASRSKDNDSPWFVLCDLMQAATGRPSDRVAPSFSTSAICALLERHGVMPENHPPENLVDTHIFTQRQLELERLATDSWSEGMATLVSEIVAVRSMSVAADVNELTRLDDQPVDCDRQERESIATALYQKVTQEVPGHREIDGTLESGSSPTCGTDAVAETVEINKGRHFLFEEDISAEDASSRPLQSPQGLSPNGPNAVAATASSAKNGCPPDGEDGATAAQRTEQAQALRSEAPRTSPPSLDMRPLPENTPGYIPSAFPKLFPFGTGDFHDPAAPFASDADFGLWGRTIMQWHDQRFMRHTRFRYFFLNTWLRMKTPGMRQVFFRTHPGAEDLTMDQLRSPETKLKVVQQMATAASNIPGTMGERRKMRQSLEGMVDQKEAETVEEYETLGRGRLPAAFCTLTCAVYKWSQLHEVLLRSYPKAERLRFQDWRRARLNDSQRCEKQKEAYYRAALANPGVVEWYCALRLELSVRLLAALVTQTMTCANIPGREAYADLLQQEMRRRLGDTFEQLKFDESVAAIGRVDDYWASYEWSGGGMVHVHVALWITGSPRVDKVIVQNPSADPPDEASRGGGREILLEEDGDVKLTDAQSANLMASFFDPFYTEWHHGKDADGRAANAPSVRHMIGKHAERKTLSPEMLSHDCLVWLLGTSTDDEAQDEGRDTLKDDEAQREAQNYSEYVNAQSQCIAASFRIQQRVYTTP